MKLRSPWIIGVAGFLIAWMVRLVGGTLRCRVSGPGANAHPADPRTACHIYAFWHESVLAMLVLRTPIRVLIGRHADGEFATQACRHLGIQVVRGSTMRGGGTALLELKNGDRAAHMALTPDGPRGPRRKAQIGVVALASLTGLPIVGVGEAFPAHGVREVGIASLSRTPGLRSTLSPPRRCASRPGSTATIWRAIAGCLRRTF